MICIIPENGLVGDTVEADKLKKHMRHELEKHRASHSSAAFISEAGREAVISYRAQVGRSSSEFVIVLHILEGNANDAPLLCPLLQGNRQATRE